MDELEGCSTVMRILENVVDVPSFSARMRCPAHVTSNIMNIVLIPVMNITYSLDDTVYNSILTKCDTAFERSCKLIPR